MAQIIAYLYMVVLSGLALYATYLVVLLCLYLWYRRDTTLPPLPTLAESELPYVTVQIPLRNELHVATRIIQAVAELDWPRDRLDIQVLDDSTDETTAIVEAEVERLRLAGVQITLLHRQAPSGYKAGALAAGLKQARGEFITIFDADFYPPKDFLRSTVPYLATTPELGMLQARWEHLNADYSAITRAQAMLLDAHFSVEHIARNRSGLLMNFNGTAGIWRKRAIVEAGGWQSDTVAEDLDLSYRAQLAGWKALYLPDVVAPAELPPQVAAFKSQQYRWAKGATQTLRKLAVPIIRSEVLNPLQKVMALLHMGAYFNLTFLLLMILLTVPMVFYNPNLPQLAAFLGGLASIPPVMYLLGQMHFRADWPRRILTTYPLLMLLGIGIAWSTTLAIVDGLLNWGGPFVRTPKFQLRGREGEWRKSKYRLGIDHTLLGEFLIGLYALVAAWLALTLQQEELLPFILMYVGGEALMVWSTLRQARFWE
jgi:cellulose synthase/poly-beta-1,6-N-acetylglucosamine synthase-like glycosyltransferase